MQPALLGKCFAIYMAEFIKSNSHDAQFKMFLVHCFIETLRFCLTLRRKDRVRSVRLRKIE